MRVFMFVVPIMMIVAWSSGLLLNRNHAEVPENTRFMIMIGASLLSGVITYFLFPQKELEQQRNERQKEKEQKK